MLKAVLMPKLSSTMSEGYVTEWFKNVGDPVKVGEPVFEVMTDKIAIEVESYDEGVLLKRYVEVGEVVPVNTIIAYIGEAGAEVPETVDKGQSAVDQEEKVEETKPEEKNEAPRQFSGKVRATPAARKLAHQKGLDLTEVYQQVQPKVRLHKKDIENYQAPRPSVVKAVTSDEVIAWKGMRKAIADQMHKSVMTAPQVTLNAKVNVESLINLRKELNLRLETKVSYTGLITAFVIKALKKHPRLNAHALEDGIHVKGSINMGIANAVDDGLIVPVIHGANDLNIVELTDKLNDTISKAKSNTLLPDDLSGGTFTITSLGSTRVTDFSPILNIPEVAILGVGTFEKVVQVDKDNQFVALNQMTLSLTFDHRAVDGYPAGLFLTDLVELIENPEFALLY